MRAKKERPRIYRNPRPLRIALTALVSIIIAALLLFTILFFSLRSRIAYNGDGLYLDMPWISDELAELRAEKEE